MRHGLAFADEGDKDWDAVGYGETDCCNAREGVKGGCGPEIDATQETVYDG